MFSRWFRSIIREVIKAGMVFALETSGPPDGWTAARIEEELVVTEGRLRGHHALPGRGAARGGRALLHRRRPAWP